MLSNIIFTDNKVPTSYRFDIANYLYNDADFIVSKYKEDLQSFYMINEKSECVVGRIHFILKDNKAISLPSSPFGYFELNKKISIEVLDKFVRHIAEKLGNKKVQHIEIASYAQAYDLNSAAKINYVLHHQGFRILTTDINHHIPIAGKFEDKIKPMHLRKLRKCKKEGLVFEEEPVSALDEVYHFILKCRAERGHGLSLEYHQMKALITKFPKRYNIFSVRKRGAIVAATIVVIVNDEIVYNFFPASAMAYNTLSPMVFLDLGLYDYCLNNKYKILDLGISPTPGLINFKEGIGGEPSLKFTFKKLLK